MAMLNAVRVIIFILPIAVSLFAQESVPLWIQDSWRFATYPNAEWYTGFAMDKIAGQPNSSTYQSIEKEAQNKLSEGIIVKVQGSSSVQVSSRQTQKSETVNTN